MKISDLTRQQVLAVARRLDVGMLSDVAVVNGLAIQHTASEALTFIHTTQFPHELLATFSIGGGLKLSKAGRNRSDEIVGLLSSRPSKKFRLELAKSIADTWKTQKSLAKGDEHYD